MDDALIACRAIQFASAMLVFGGAAFRLYIVEVNLQPLRRVGGVGLRLDKNFLLAERANDKGLRKWSGLRHRLRGATGAEL